MDQLAELLGLRERMGKTLVIITHDNRIAAAAERINFLAVIGQTPRGRVVQPGQQIEQGVDGVLSEVEAG